MKRLGKNAARVTSIAVRPTTAHALTSAAASSGNASSLATRAAASRRQRTARPARKTVATPVANTTTAASNTAAARHPTGAAAAAAATPTDMSAAGAGRGNDNSPLPAFAGIAVPNHAYPPAGAPYFAGSYVPVFIAGRPYFPLSNQLSVPGMTAVSTASSSGAVGSSSGGAAAGQAILGATLRSAGITPTAVTPAVRKTAAGLLSGSRGASAGTALTRRASLPGGFSPAREIHTDRDTSNHSLFTALRRKASALPEVLYQGPSASDVTSESPRWRIPLRQATLHALGVLQGLDSYSRSAWGDGAQATLIAHAIRDEAAALDDALPPGIPIADVPLPELLRLLAAELNSPTPDVDRLLTWANTACFEARRIAAEAPLFAVDEAGVQDYRLILRMLDEARKSSLASVKQNYCRELAARVLPRCETDISFLQGISMLAGYLDLPAGLRFPFTPRTSLLLPLEHQSKVSKTRTLVLKHIVLQTGGRYAGVRQQYYEGRDKDDNFSGLLIINSMGTNSDGANRDVVLKAKQVATGALANIDPRGVGYTASQAAAPRQRELLENYPEDTVVVSTGHSLGASVAVELFHLLHLQGFVNSYLAGFNGGAINHDVPEEVLRAARTNARFVQNQGDPVPYGGRHLLPGVEKIHTAQTVGTIARGTPHPIIPNLPDVINHGIPNEVAQVMFGVPGTASLQLHNELVRGWRRNFFMVLRNYFSWLPDKALTTVLKPDPIEAGKTEDTFIEDHADDDADGDAPAKKR
ncbi:hypothetical protein JGU66_06385 [Myxococcaceae bacterium JPH2]|nr:hypothetical protein [Myxococcaceae bacterium JPH2]